MKCLTWDEALYYGEIETIAEFETIEDALKEYENGGYNPDLYGVE